MSGSVHSCRASDDVLQWDTHGYTYVLYFGRGHDVTQPLLGMVGLIAVREGRWKVLEKRVNSNKTSGNREAFTHLGRP